MLARIANNVRVIDYAIVPDAPSARGVYGARVRVGALARLRRRPRAFLEYLNDTVSSETTSRSCCACPRSPSSPSAASLTRRRLLPGGGGGSASPSRNGGAAPELLSIRIRVLRWPKPTGTCALPCCCLRREAHRGAACDIEFTVRRQNDHGRQHGDKFGADRSCGAGH